MDSKLSEATVYTPLDTLVSELARRDLECPISVGELEPYWSPVASLWAGPRASIDRLLAYQRAFSTDLDAKGQAAYLITQYSHGLAVPLAAAVVKLGIAPDLSIERVAFRLEAREITYQGRTVAGERLHLRFTSSRFVTDDPGCASPEAHVVSDRRALCDHVRVAIEAHFAPLIDLLHAYSALSRSAMWRLVGDSIAGVFLEVGRATGRIDEARRDALDILKQKGSPLSNKEMRYVDLVLVDEEAPERVVASHCFRARGGCCRYYTVEGGSLCSACVLKDPAERDARILAGMRSRLGRAGETAVLRVET